jgi:D-sedoheptulose 7-phosphate isomerase
MNINERISHRAKLINDNTEIFIKSVEDISAVVSDSIKNKNKIMFCGNGGSAAESQHMAAEYCATLNHMNPRLGFAAISLTVDTSFITAWTNDFGYEEVFARQVETLGRHGDVLICYTTSGTSPNIVRAAKVAKSKGIKVVLFTGENKKLEIKKYCDLILHAPSSNTAFIQEIHTIIGHEVCLDVETRLAKNND